MTSENLCPVRLFLCLSLHSFCFLVNLLIICLSFQKEDGHFLVAFRWALGFMTIDSKTHRKPVIRLGGIYVSLARQAGLESACRSG